MNSDRESYAKEYEKHITQNIEKYGFHICFIEEGEYLPSFAYTIGLYETYKHPEVIIFGLKLDVMSHVLNTIGKDIKKGVKFLSDVDYNGFIKDYPIKLLEVEVAHYEDYLGFAGWYYSETFDFPVYQAVWTDKNGKYPWEKDFNESWKLRQPLLDRNVDFKFYEDRRLGVYTTKAVMNGATVVKVYHDKDGDWQFHNEDSRLEEHIYVCFEDVVRKDSTLNKIYYLNFGECAIREDLNSEWEVYKYDE